MRARFSLALLLSLGCGRIGFDASVDRLDAGSFDAGSSDANAPIVEPLGFASTPWLPGGGLSNADNHCMADASAAGIDRPFIAIVASSAGPTSMRIFLGSIKPAWFQRDGTEIAQFDAKAAVLSVAPFTQLADASGASVGTAWVGSQGPSSGGTESCGDWLETTGQAWISPLEFTEVDWHQARELGACNVARHLLCLEQ